MTAASRGVDVSAYQPVQNWSARKAEGVVFAFAKASEGQSTHDSRFATHIKGIKAAGLVPGAYHFAWPNQSAAKEAANYIAAVKPYAGKGFCHWLDLEEYSDGRNYKGRTAAQIKAYATEWIAAVTKAFPGQRVGIYTSGSDLSAGHVPAGVPLWYPAYSWGYSSVSYATAEAHSQPRPSGRAPLLWQFTSTPIDRSICYLTPAQLRDWAAGDAPEDNDMQLNDAVTLNSWIKADWPKDAGLADGKIAVNTALGSTYGHARATHDATTQILAELKAQRAALTTLAGLVGKGDVDTAAVVAAVQQAIADAVVHVEIDTGDQT